MKRIYSVVLSIFSTFVFSSAFFVRINADGCPVTISDYPVFNTSNWQSVLTLDNAIAVLDTSDGSISYANLNSNMTNPSKIFANSHLVTFPVDGGYYVISPDNSLTYKTGPTNIDIDDGIHYLVLCTPSSKNPSIFVTVPLDTCFGSEPEPTPTISPEPTPTPTPEPGTNWGMDDTGIDGLYVSVQPYIDLVGYSVSEVSNHYRVTGDIVGGSISCTNTNNNSTCSVGDFDVDLGAVATNSTKVNSEFSAGIIFRFSENVKGYFSFDMTWGENPEFSSHVSLPVVDEHTVEWEFFSYMNSQQLSLDGDWRNEIPVVSNLDFSGLSISTGIKVSDDVLQSLVNMGTSVSQGVSDALENTTSSFDSVSSDYDSLESGFVADMDSSLQDISVTDLSAIDGFVNSAQWVSSKFTYLVGDDLIGSNPLGLALTFSLLLGLAVLIIGRRL